MKFIEYLQSRLEWQKKILLYTVVGILALLLFFFWLQRLKNTFLEIEAPDFLQLKEMKEEFQSQFGPIKENTEALKSVLREKTDEIRKIEEALTQTVGSTAGNTEIMEEPAAVY